MLVFIVRYRHDSKVHRGHVDEKSFKIEISWTAATLVIFFGLFVWGANLYVRQFQPPAGALRISVIGKQWMWKIQHQGGQAEINALHVPLGRPVELLMTSEDVIHDFAIPAFRIKHDVLPGRYETLWFTATSPGSFPLYCTQFCGTDHSVMGGQVVVLPPAEYETWLAANAASATLADQGKTLFVRHGCSGCHVAGGRGGNGTVRAPPLDGVYGHPVPLDDGQVVIADDRYIRDSILMPASQIVAGYPNRMPSFAGAVTEEDLIRLIAYIKSLAGEGGL
jgi:cytochrome c oxidase subunit 2